MVLLHICGLAQLASAAVLVGVSLECNREDPAGADEDGAEDKRQEADCDNAANHQDERTGWPAPTRAPGDMLRVHALERCAGVMELVGVLVVGGFESVSLS